MDSFDGWITQVSNLFSFFKYVLEKGSATADTVLLLIADKDSASQLLQLCISTSW